MKVLVGQKIHSMLNVVTEGTYTYDYTSRAVVELVNTDNISLVGKPSASINSRISHLENNMFDWEDYLIIDVNDSKFFSRTSVYAIHRTGLFKTILVASHEPYFRDSVPGRYIQFKTAEMKIIFDLTCGSQYKEAYDY